MEQTKKMPHWTTEQDTLLRESIGKIPLPELEKLLNRNENAIKLYMHRNNIAARVNVAINLVKQLLTIRFLKPEFFMPTKEFYHDVKINQKRWHVLYRGEESPTEDEYARLIEYFGIQTQVNFEKSQKTLFE